MRFAGRANSIHHESILHAHRFVHVGPPDREPDHGSHCGSDIATVELDVEGDRSNRKVEYGSDECDDEQRHEQARIQSLVSKQHDGRENPRDHQAEIVKKLDDNEGRQSCRQRSVQQDSSILECRIGCNEWRQESANNWKNEPAANTLWLRYGRSLRNLYHFRPLFAAGPDAPGRLRALDLNGPPDLL